MVRFYYQTPRVPASSQVLNCSTAQLNWTRDTAKLNLLTEYLTVYLSTPRATRRRAFHLVSATSADPSHRQCCRLSPFRPHPYQNLISFLGRTRACSSSSIPSKHTHHYILTPPTLGYSFGASGQPRNPRGRCGSAGVHEIPTFFVRQREAGPRTGPSSEVPPTKSPHPPHFLKAPYPRKRPSGGDGFPWPRWLASKGPNVLPAPPFDVRCAPFHRGCVRAHARALCWTVISLRTCGVII